MRLIDADELLRDNMWECFDEWGNYTRAGQAVADAPTIDAVEVVRCKECKHYEVFPTWSACTYWSGDPYEQASVNADDFCSYGEREGE